MLKLLPEIVQKNCKDSFTDFLNGGHETGDAKETQITAVQSQLLPVPYNPTDITAANSENFKAEVAQFTDHFCSQVATSLPASQK